MNVSPLTPRSSCNSDESNQLKEMFILSVVNCNTRRLRFSTLSGDIYFIQTREDFIICPTRFCSHPDHRKHSKRETHF